MLAGKLFWLGWQWWGSLRQFGGSPSDTWAVRVTLLPECPPHISKQSCSQGDDTWIQRPLSNVWSTMSKAEQWTHALSITAQVHSEQTTPSLPPSPFKITFGKRNYREKGILPLDGIDKDDAHWQARSWPVTFEAATEAVAISWWAIPAWI